MRTLLRKISTGLFFQGPDRWTSNPEEAMNFKSIDRALQFVETWDLKEVDLAFAFNDAAEVTVVALERMATRYAQD
jgi:hypothetical protein